MKALFPVCVVLSAFAILWGFVLYDLTSAVFSDLPQYGIKYRGEAYLEIVSIAERQIRLVGVPMVVMLSVSLITWGIQIFRESRSIRAAAPRS